MDLPVLTRRAIGDMLADVGRIAGSGRSRWLAQFVVAAGSVLTPSTAGAQAPRATRHIPVDPALCSAWIHDWARGTAHDPGLVTFGTPYLAPSALPATQTGPKAEGAPPVTWELARRRSTERAGVGVNLRADRGPVLAGASEPTELDGVYRYEDPRPRAGHLAAARVRSIVSRGPFLAAVDLAWDGREVRARAADVSWSVPRLTLRAGALAMRAAPTCRDGLVLGGRGGPAWGVEARQRRGLHLGFLGSVLVGLQLGTLAEAGPDDTWPLFHAMRVEVRPGEGWVVGLNRAVVFGGSRSSVPVTPRTVGLMLLGITDARGKDSDFENQVASVDVRWRGRFGGRPMLVTAEYGTDDSGLAFVRVPGFRVTGELAWSAERDAWIGLDLTALARSRHDYPPWYRHGALAWGWTDRGTPLGSFLAGQGVSALITYRNAHRTSTFRVAAGPVLRGSENLFSPPLQGAGAHVSASLRLALGAWDVTSTASWEHAGVTALSWTSSLIRAF